MGKKDFVFLGKVFNLDFKRIILDVLLMHCNQCINLFPEKCRLGRIPICCQEMCSEDLKFSPVSFSTRYLESWNTNCSQKSQFVCQIFFKITNLSLFCREIPKRCQWKRIGRTSFWNTANMSNTKDRSVLVRKKGLTLTFTWLNEVWCN